MAQLAQDNFDAAAYELGLDFVVSASRSCPKELAELLHGKFRLAARRLARVGHLEDAAAQDALAHTVGFDSWATLDRHLIQVPTVSDSSAALRWREALTRSVVLLSEPPCGVALPLALASRFETFAQSLAAEARQPVQLLLDGVCARFCACTAWSDARCGDSPSPGWQPTSN
jgi:hypothetical protein